LKPPRERPAGAVAIIVTGGMGASAPIINQKDFSTAIRFPEKYFQSTRFLRQKIFNRDPIDRPDCSRRRPGKIVGCTTGL
jgi:hypothetical protein